MDCKSFKHLQISELTSSEKLDLYCKRVRRTISCTGLGYYEILYGKDYEQLLWKYHPENMESLCYWRKQSHHIERNIYISYRIINLFLVDNLWKNRKDFIKDCVKNWLVIVGLYFDTVKQYFELRKYLRNNCKVKGVR